MRLEALESRSDGFSPLHRLDGRFKLLFALFYVIAVIATPAGWWRTLGVLALLLVFLAGLCGISPRWLLLRWLGFLALVGMLAAVAAPGLAARSGVGLLTAAFLHPGQEQPCLRDDADAGRGHLVARPAAGDAPAGSPPRARRDPPAHGALHSCAGRRARPHAHRPPRSARFTRGATGRGPC